MAFGNNTIHLLRHGEVNNPGNILYGRRPGFHLSDKGRHQATTTGHYLKDRPLAAIFTSPMLRARQTAKLIVQKHHRHLKLRVSTLINEVHTSYEGRPGAEIDSRNGDIYTGSDTGSEQPEDIVARTRKFILRMQHQYAGGHIAAITHGDVITFMVLWATGFALTAQNKIRLLQAGYPVAYPAHASITTLTYRISCPDEKPAVKYVCP